MKKVLPFLAVFFLLLSTNQLTAQPGCPAVNPGNSLTLPCGQHCTTLHANTFFVGQTDQYTVNQISYNPPYGFNVGNPILVATDDLWSNVINLPFTFCFFGNAYNQILVGSNGCISFNTANAGAYNTWPIGAAVPTTTGPADIMNCIMAPWQDIDPTNTGLIRYQISGSYPCRQFEVSWYQIPYYGDNNSVNTGYCGAALNATMQVVLYETTNAIEIYINNKDLCTGWNGGYAIEGIQNATGTAAYTVPGRNYPNTWTASNDAWRFTPSGTSIVTVNWLQNGNVISTNDSAQVCINDTSTFTAEAVYHRCDGSNVTVTGTVFVGLSGVTASIDSIHNVSCYGASDGAVYASYNTSSAVLSYGWSPGGPGQTSLTNIPAGTYVFSVTDAGGCTRYDTVQVTQPPQLIVTVPDTIGFSCDPNAIKASLTAHVVGGIPGYTYSWPGGQTDSTVINLSSGTYTVTVTDNHACTATGTGTIGVTLVTPSFAPPDITDVSCNGGNNGSIIVTVDSAQPPIIYTWSAGGSVTNTASGLSAGTYDVTAVDDHGCSVTASYTVNQPTPILFANPLLEDATCLTGGSITASATGGTGSITYTWSNSVNGATDTALAAGTYIVTATDQNGCTATASYIINTTGGSAVLNTPTIVNVLCNGDDNGSIIAVGTGTGPVTYSWSNSVNGPIDSLLGAGTYSVTITDSIGCSASASYNVTQPNQLLIDSSLVIGVTCAGPNSGSVTLFVSGGTPVYSYSWTGSLAGNPLTGLAAGSYDVTVTDNNGCSTSASYTINPYTLLNIDSANVADASCVVPGSISVYASGGIAPLSYVWSNVENGSIDTALAPGNYTVTITDLAGCTVTATYTVNAIGNAVGFGNPVITNVSCNGGNTGSIVASATGGSGTITFTWSNSESGPADTLLVAGTYSVTITDTAGCSASTSYVVSQPTPITVDSSNIVNQQCIGLGSVTVYASGGTGTLTYTWGNGQVGNTDTALTAGSYTVTITDQNGCSTSASFNVGSAPNSLNIDSAHVQDVTCSGVNSGAITLYVSGGTSPITYDWTGGLTGNPLTGLAAGTYGVTITDNNGCSISGSYDVNPYNAMQFNNPVIVDATCAHPGSITASVTGGTGTITYTWSNVFTGATDTALAAGSYTVTATDQAGCSVSVAYTVNSLGGAVGFGNPVITNVGCNGGNNGSIAVTPTGGSGPISFNWSNGEHGSSDTLLIAGTYTVTITDTLGCSASATYNVTQPNEISIDSATVVDYQCNGPGSITVYVSGGTPAYSYQWSNSASVNSNTNLNPGSYTVTVSDQHGCTVQGTYQVQPLGNPIVLGNNPVIVNPLCNGSNNGSISITYTGGTGAVTLHWSNGESGTSDTALIVGTYTVTATDLGGCSVTASYTLTAPNGVNVNLNYSHLICFNDSTGTATANATGGSGTYTYQWNPASGNVSSINNLHWGFIAVTVTDNVGCSASASGVISQTPQLWYTSIVQWHLCSNNPYGDLSLQPRYIGGGNLLWPLTFNVSGIGNVTATGVGSDTSGEFPNIPPGSYTFTITDSMGCSATGTFDVPQSAGNDSIDFVATPTTCFGTQFTDGTISLSPVDQNGPYTYSLNGGASQNDSVFTGLGAGTYQISITNNYGCVKTIDVVVNQPAQITVNASPDTIMTAPGVDNPITVTTSAQNPVFSWSPVTGLSCSDCYNPNANVDSSTIFFVTVADSANLQCTAYDSVVVIVSAGIIMPNAFSPNADGRNDEYGPVTTGNANIKSFRIYNRWGELVHDANTTWDGTFKGAKQPVGTYVYYISVEIPDPQNPGTNKTLKQQGSFVLLR